MTRLEMQTSVVDALKAAPKPITADAAALLAIDTLKKLGAGREADQLREWAKTNGEHLAKVANQ